MSKMRSALTTAAIVAALMLVGSAQAGGGPVTKQNGSSPVLNFTPICAVAGYADYGLCGGSTSTFSGVGGKLNAIQPKLGTYNFEFLFSEFNSFIRLLITFPTTTTKTTRTI